MDSNQSTKEKLIHKANELTEREVAVTLAILLQHHNDVVIIRNKDYLLSKPSSMFCRSMLADLFTSGA